MRRFDLHLHSTHSDGTLPPAAVLQRCAEAGLDAVALTDHDLVSTLAPGPHTFGDRTVHLYAGAEVSGTHEGTEYHLLCYFPGEAPRPFREFCTEQSRSRADRYATAVTRMGVPGLPAPDDDALTGARALTRLHLARALVDAGHATTVSDAFARFTGHRHGNVPPIAFPFTEAIRFARSLGAVTSWAHPPIGPARQYVETFAAAGLQGLEALRPRLATSHKRTLKKLAKRHGLFLTGGSDWHGWGGHQLGLFHVTRYELSGFLDALAA